MKKLYYVTKLPALVMVKKDDNNAYDGKMSYKGMKEFCDKFAPKEKP